MASTYWRDSELVQKALDVKAATSDLTGTHWVYVASDIMKCEVYKTNSEMVHDENLPEWVRETLETGNILFA